MFSLKHALMTRIVVLMGHIMLPLQRMVMVFVIMVSIIPPCDSRNIANVFLPGSFAIVISFIKVFAC